MLVGNLVSIFGGGLITVILTLVSSRVRLMASSFLTDDGPMTLQQQETSAVWDSTRDIDNPLRPWAELYTRYDG